MNTPQAPRAESLLSGTLRVFLSEALMFPVGLATTAVLTRQLGPTSYGLLTLAATVVAWVEWSVSSMLTRLSVVFVSEATDWRPMGTAVLRLHLCLYGGAAVLLWVAAPLFERLFGEPTITTYLRLFALDVPIFGLAQAHRSILTGLGRFRERARATVGRWIGRLILITALVVLGFSVTGAILGTIGASLVDLIISRYYVRPVLLGRTSLTAARFAHFAGPLFLSALSLRLYDKLDLFLLKSLGGTAAQAGIYGATQNLTLVPGIFALSFSPLFLAVLSRAWGAGDHRRVVVMSRNAMRLVVGLLPLAALVAGANTEIVSLIFGAAFLPAAPLLAVLIFGALALLMISVTTAILVGVGLPGWTLALTGPLIPLALAGHLVLIPRFGSLGAVWVTTVVAGLGAAALVVAVYRILQIIPPLGTAWRSIVVGGVTYILARLWPAPGVWVLLKCGALAVFILVAFFLVGEFNAAEVADMRSRLPARFARQRSH